MSLSIPVWNVQNKHVLVGPSVLGGGGRRGGGGKTEEGGTA